MAWTKLTLQGHLDTKSRLNFTQSISTTLIQCLIKLHKRNLPLFNYKTSTASHLCASTLGSLGQLLVQVGGLWWQLFPLHLDTGWGVLPKKVSCHSLSRSRAKPSQTETSIGQGLPVKCLRVSNPFYVVLLSMSSLTKNLEYEERKQLDSGVGGALSQGAGHDGSFFW